jgi:serine/threonine-protein kinase
VQVYAVGEHDQHLFFVWEYVEGGDLTRMLSGAPQPPRQVAQFVNLLAQAMHVVHQQGIVHRDLKPSNVLLTAEGIPKICDFGLAKRMDEAAMSMTGALLGTPRYMSPEQTAGEAMRLALQPTCTLGAILYEMLTARPPFTPGAVGCRAASPFSTDLIPTTTKLPRELETICEWERTRPGYAALGRWRGQAFLAGGQFKRSADPGAALKWVASAAALRCWGQQ